MFASFFESVKYVGHLLPISFLRVFLGYYYLELSMNSYRGDFLLRPRLAAIVSEALPTLSVPGWYRLFLETMVIPHWQICAFILLGFQFAVAISYLLGYVVRPMALIGMAISFFYLTWENELSLNAFISMLLFSSLLFGGSPHSLKNV